MAKANPPYFEITDAHAVLTYKNKNDSAPFNTINIIFEYDEVSWGGNAKVQLSDVEYARLIALLASDEENMRNEPSYAKTIRQNFISVDLIKTDSKINLYRRLFSLGSSFTFSKTHK